jgi:hypothetical protein
MSKNIAQSTHRTTKKKSLNFFFLHFCNKKKKIPKIIGNGLDAGLEAAQAFFCNVSRMRCGSR